MNLWQLSWKSLTHKPLAMTLSLVLFALGVGLISFLFLMEKQLQDNFEKNLAKVDLVIGAKGSPLQMILSAMYHVDAPTGNIALNEIRPFLNPKHPLIQEVVPLSLGDSYKGYRIVGTTSNILEWYEAEISEGRLWKYNFDVTIGATAAKELGLSIGDEFKSSHGLMDAEDLEHDDAQSFIVTGILKSTGSVIDQLILTTPQSFWLVHDHESEVAETGEESDEDHDHADHEGHDHVDHEGHDHADHVDMAKEIPKGLMEENGEKEITNLLIRFKGRNFQALNMQRSINENTDMQAATPAIEINRLFSLMDSGEKALRLLAFIIIFVSGLSIFISLYSSLNERKYELALMRSMGASRTTIFGHIIIEGIILAILGFLLGIVVSHLGMTFVSQFLKDSYRYNFSGLQFLTKEWFILIGSLLIGFIAALIPAIEASKTDIADTLTQSKN
jgi:putative ABC transport system permease protein